MICDPEEASMTIVSKTLLIGVKESVHVVCTLVALT
jgi:hypothetical protein